ncbi:MAG TPA: hypothetical protein PKN56_23640 [Leptospiraceae bacterium]|nr:hypothetical protein [Leptospiraceae bacterium]
MNLNVRTFFAVSFGAVVLLLIYMLVATPGSSSKRKRIKAERLGSALFGGGAGTGDSDSACRGCRVKAGSSVFDDDFTKVGVNFDVQEESKKDPSKGEAPIDPRTGKPYDDATMEEFDRLRELFPSNELIPKRFNPDEKAAKAQAEQEYNKAIAAVSSGNPSKDDVKLYYNKQIKTIKDRLEIVEYLLDALKEEGGEGDKDGQFQKIMEGTKQQLTQMETQKSDAYTKFGVSGD